MAAAVAGGGWGGIQGEAQGHDEGEMIAGVVLDIVNSTARALAGAMAEEIGSRRSEWTGLGAEWLRSLLGKREWRIECMDVYIRL